MTEFNSTGATLLIYGAAGYTGRLICQQAIDRGLKFEIAGREQDGIAQLAKQLNVSYHTFSVDDQQGWARGLSGKLALLNVAGPFSATADLAMEACIENRVHYIDISAEVDIYRLAQSKDGKAKASGIMIMPGAGLFVCYDPLVVHTAKRSKNPQSLRVAFKYSGGFTPGSVASSANIVNAGYLVRKDGELVKLPEAKPVLFDFGAGPEECLLTPLGGTVLSYKSTGIRNIEEYFQMALPAGLSESETLKTTDTHYPASMDARDEKSFLLAEVTGEDGRIVQSKLEMPAGYSTTVYASVEIASRTLEGNFKEGFQSPASAFGEELLESIPGLNLLDIA